MGTTQIGRSAEDFVSEYLVKQGFRITTQNWRTRSCEIDIIATKQKCAYFIEVKYRKSDTWGDGLEAITSKKLQQMTFAAQQWVQSNNWRNDYRLMVASVTGNPHELLALVELD